MTSKKSVLTIFKDGSLDYAPMPVGELRRLGEYIIQAADNVMLPGTPQQQPAPDPDAAEGANTAPPED